MMVLGLNWLEKMIIDCISDLHGYYPKLEGGDLLIVAGDLTARDQSEEYNDFCTWLMNQSYKKKIFIGGNHDNLLTDSIPKIHTCPVRRNLDTNNYLELFEYLCDSGTEFNGLKIWGAPWTLKFDGMNPHCMAFTCDTEEELAEKWGKIPYDVDILITHSPSFGNYDWIKNRDRTVGPSVGSLSLWMKCLEIRPKLHVFGHIHEAYGHCEHSNGIKLINASHVNERYEPINKPIRMIL